MMTIQVEQNSGLLLVNKPSGPTTYDLIRWLKKPLNGIKMGHAGTLDPLATGLVVVLLGKTTKMQSIFMKFDKLYRCKFKLGVQTDTGDITGQVVKTMRVPAIEKTHRQAILESFLGEQMQIPPLYSALKHKGMPLYKYARKGQHVERPERKIHVRSVELVSSNGSDEWIIRTLVSSGTYIRTLVEDIGQRLDSCATVLELDRESVGAYRVQDAVDGILLKSYSATHIWSYVKTPS